MGDLLDIEIDCDNGNTEITENRWSKIRKRLAMMESNITSVDIVRMRESKLFWQYSSNKTHVKFENYLNDDYSWKIKQIILQLKLGISHLTYNGKKIRANVLEYMYKYVESDKCKLCGREVEDVFHMMYNCPHYSCIRYKFKIFINNDKYDRGNYLNEFNNLDKTNAVKIYDFFYDVFRLREEYLLEMRQ